MEFGLDRMELQAKLLELSEIVGSTYGPDGGFVGFSDGTLTKDGVHVARLLHRDSGVGVWRLAAKILLDACEGTVREVGDGTTTTALLVGQFLERGLDEVWVEAVDLILEEYSWEPGLSDLEAVALASTDGKAGLSEAVAGMVWDIGSQGKVEGRISYTDRTYAEVRRGYVFASGVYHPRFLMQQKTVTLERPLVAIVEQKVDDYKELFALIEAYQRVGAGRPLVIVAGFLEDKPLRMVFNNSLSPDGSMNVFVVKSPSEGMDRLDRLEDLALGSGAVVHSRFHRDVGDFVEEGFGELDSVVLGMSETRFVFLDKYSGAIADRVEYLESLEGEDRGPSVKERVSLLTRGVGLLYYAAPTQVELKVLEEAAEDAILACQAALRGGVIPGGGYVWRQLADRVDERFGELCKRLPGSGREKVDGVLDVADVYRRALTTALSVSQMVRRMEYIVGGKTDLAYGKVAG